LFASVLLCPKSGLSLTENYASPLNSSSGIVAQSGLSQEADRLFQKASQLYDKGTEESLHQAIKIWKQAQQLYQGDRSKVREAQILHWIASAYYNLGDWQQSLHANEQALPIVEATVDQGQTERLYVADVLYQMGEASIKLGLWKQAIQHYSKAKQLFSSLYHSNYELTWNGQSMVYWQGRTSYEIGVANQWLKNYDQAAQSYQQAVFLFNIIVAKEDRTSKKVLIVGDPWKHDVGKVYALNQLGSLFEELGRFDRALEANQKALPILQRVCVQATACDQKMLVSLLTDISRGLYETGDSALGERYLNQARDLLPTVKSQRDTARILSIMGLILVHNNQPKEGLIYLNQAASYYVEKQDWQNAGRTRLLIAQAHKVLNSMDKNQLIDFYRTQVLPFLEKAKDNEGMAIVDYDLGSIYISLEPEKALNFLTKAKEFWERKKVSNLSTLADIYHGLTIAYSRSNNLKRALEEVDKAINIAEYFRNTIDNRDLRASYFSTVQSYYEAKIYILVRLSQQAPNYSKRLSCELEAFDVSEQTRSRTLLGLLTRSRIELNLEKVKPNFRDEANRLQLALKDAEKKLDFATSPKELAKIEQQYIELSRQLDSLVDGNLYQPSEDNIAIKDSSPRSLTDSDCLSDDKANSDKIKNIYVGVVPNNVPLLQYYLGESASYLFVSSKSQNDESSAIVFSFKVYTLPGRKEIEAAAEKFYKRLKNVDPPEAIAQTGECLRQKILPRDFLDTYKKERLVISADGVLHNIPFAALPLPNTQGKKISNTADSDACKESSSATRFQNYVPLVTQHEIINVPSISSIYAIRQRSFKPAPKALAILADPRFDITKQSARSECPSLRSGSKEGTNRSNSSQDLASDVEAALRSTGGVRKQLPCTRIEAGAILSEVNEPGQTLSAFDTDATQQWVMQPSLSQYRILHFATHGFSSDSQPELSGLVLSRFNRQGQPIEDYFLRLNEIFNLRLSAELVVLSACETGLGKNLRGEGIIGLTRGFMSAGAKRVIASLWNVGDRSTAELMAKFYHRMLKEGLSPSAALQQTQIEMWRAKRNPNKWAAFAFYGEWEK
jgi:tetratricopeptide (TPR) repeat protein